MVLPWWNLDQVTNRPLLELESWIPGEFQRTSWPAVPGRGLVDLSAWKTPKLMNRKGNMIMNILCQSSMYIVYIYTFLSTPKQKIRSNWFYVWKETIEFDNFGPCFLWCHPWWITLHSPRCRSGLAWCAALDEVLLWCHPVTQWF